MIYFIYKLKNFFWIIIPYQIENPLFLFNLNRIEKLIKEWQQINEIIALTLLVSLVFLTIN